MNSLQWLLLWVCIQYSPLLPKMLQNDNITDWELGQTFTVTELFITEILLTSEQANWKIELVHSTVHFMSSISVLYG